MDGMGEGRSFSFIIRAIILTTGRAIKEPQHPVQHSIAPCVPAQDMQRMLWPRRADCAQDFPSIPPAHLLPTFYLPPESQGVRCVPPDAARRETTLRRGERGL